MAVNDQNNQGQTPGQQNPTTDQYNREFTPGHEPNLGAHAGGQQRTAGPGFASLNQLFKRAGSVDLSETRSSEALKALTDAYTKAVEGQQLDDSFKLLRFDSTQNRVALSAILVARLFKISNKNFAIVRPLVLDTDANRLKPLVYTHNAQRFEMPRIAKDVVTDGKYWDRIGEFMMDYAGDRELTVLNAGFTIVPSDTNLFDIKDELNASVLLITSANRVDDVVWKIRGEQPFTLANFKQPNERLTSRVDFTGEPVETLTGVPVRADILITMNRQLTQNQDIEELYEAESEINSVAGFVNLEFTPPQQQQQLAYGQPPKTQLFTPTFNITRVSQAPWIQAQTPELYLLAISNAYRVTAGTMWARAFLPTVGKTDKKGIDPKDIGALGYLTPQGTNFDTKSDNFDDNQFAEVMQTLVFDRPSFLIDIDPVGDNSLIESYFLDAAFPTENRERARQILIEAADNLTGKHFSPIFHRMEEAAQRRLELVVPYNQEINLGYYVDANGNKRDIRDLDVLAMLNLCQGDLNTFYDWYQTLVDTAQRNEMRLQRREGFERNYLSKDMKITSRAQRLLLTPHFIEALDQATRAAGVDVQMDNVTQVFGTQRFAGNQMVGAYTVSQSAPMSYGSTPGGNTYGTGYTGGNGGGRYY